MKTRTVQQIIALALLLATTPLFAEEAPRDFPGELRTLRLNLVQACAQLQAGKPATDAAHLFGEIDAIIAAWQTMSATWRDTPPEAYASDPAWAGYFDEALDNFTIMRQRAEQGNYRRAAQFCGMNCRLFVNINQVNGIDKTSDRLFHIRMGARQMMERVRAANWQDAHKMLANTQNQFEQFVAAPPSDAAEAGDFAGDMQTIRDAFAPVADAVKSGDAAAAGAHFGPYLRTFREVYVKYL